MTPRLPKWRTSRYASSCTVADFGPETAQFARHLAAPAPWEPERTRPKLVLNAPRGRRHSVIITGRRRSRAFVAVRVCRFAAERAAVLNCDMETKPRRSAGRSVHQPFANWV
ncbi:hypothetical protein RHECNPAF_2940057 [Rhizobium etli CNPAF512]|nr:hypothetical protein RHECNPAF_2940057 [Rhizobium etli CNPAF512]